MRQILCEVRLRCICIGIHIAATRYFAKVRRFQPLTPPCDHPWDPRETLLNKLGPSEQRVPASKQRSNARSEKSGGARQYRGIVVDLRLFRMRSDRDAINNDALTDPMAGGRPHESHDLTFAWVGCPRPIARARASRRESRSQCDFYARHPREREREKRESNFKCNGYRRCAAAISRALRTFAFSLHSPPWPLSSIP